MGHFPTVKKLLRLSLLALSDSLSYVYDKSEIEYHCLHDKTDVPVT